MGLFTGKKFANIYKGILNVGNDNTGITSTKKAVQTADGVDSKLQLSTTDVNVVSGFELGGFAVQTALANLAGLTYASPSFIKVTAEDTYVIRTLAEALSDLSGVANSTFDFNGQNVISDNFKLLTDYDGDLEAALTAIGATVTTLIINMQPDDLTGAEEVPTTTHIDWLKGYPLGGAFTLTFNGSLTAGDYQLFSSDLTVEGDIKAPFVTPQWWGATGDSSTDDTVPIQACLTSPAKNIVLGQGYTYIIDGGLTSSVTGRTINATGSTIKLKTSASDLGMLDITGEGTHVIGGIWDGNRSNGNATGDTYASYAVLIGGADYCTISNITAKDQWGIGIKIANANDTRIEKCTISGTDHYGIYGEALTQTNYRTYIINNTVDVSTNTSRGQGVLLTSSGAYDDGNSQEDWKIIGNDITGPQGALGDQPICLNVRGNNGIVSNNTTHYGSMGFSEGGSNTLITDNKFLDIQGTTAYGIEPSGGTDITIVNNTITGAARGIATSGAYNFDRMLISGNNITATSSGTCIFLQIADGSTAHNISIIGNPRLQGRRGVSTVGDIRYLKIMNNSFIGPGSGTAQSRGIFLGTPTAAVEVFVSNNSFSGFEVSQSIFKATSGTFTDMFATNNYYDDSNSSGVWTVEGSAVIGARVFSTKTIGADGYKNTIDQLLNVTEQWSVNNNSPEGVVSAGIGSIYHSLNSAGDSFRKATGTGNTGWISFGEHRANSGTDHALLDVTPGTATASRALVVNASKDINLDTGDLSATLGTFSGSITTNSNYPIEGLSTGRSVRRTLELTIENGSNANTLKLTTYSRYNHTAISVVDNVAKNATTGGYTLSSGGDLLTIENSILEGTVIAVGTATIKRIDYATPVVVQVGEAGGDIANISFLTFAVPGVYQDMTTIVDGGGFATFAIIIDYWTSS